MKLTLTLNQTQEAVLDCLRAGLVPLVKSSPGCGKSDMMRQVADKFNLKVIDIRLAQSDPVELNGFPDLEGNFATFKPFDIFPTENTPIPEGFSGWLLFFDELTSANKSVQAASYKIILDRMVGQHNIHPQALMVAAGNRLEDRAVVTNMSTALQSRLVHLNMSPSHEEVINHFADNSFAPEITAYLEWNKQHMNSFSPDHQDDTFACPRTWSFLNQLIQTAWKGSIPEDKKPIIAGTLGLGVANEFSAFCRIWKDLPSIKEVLNDPEGIDIPDDIGTRYAMTGMLASHMTKDNGDVLMKVVSRMPQSMALLCMRIAYRGNRSVIQCNGVRNFIAKHRKEWIS